MRTLQLFFQERTEFYQTKIKFSSFLIMLTCLLASFLFQINTARAQSAQFVPCTGCTANDDHVDSVVLVQKNPAYAPGNGQPEYINFSPTCDGNTTVTGYLKITFTQQATTRYGISLAGNILVDGQFYKSFTFCDPATTNSGSFVKYISSFSIPYTCGTKLELKDLFIGWGNSSGNNVCPIINNQICSASPHCEQLPLNPTDPPIVVVTPLSADFSATGSCSGQTAQSYSFDALDAISGTTGGTPPYTSYNWTIARKFAPSTILTTLSGSNPSFDFSQTGFGPDIYTVTLTVGDDNPTTQSSVSKDITVVSTQPNAGTSGTLSICTGSTVTEAQLNAVIGTHDAGSWSPALAGAGTYTYTVAATAPCTEGATSTVTVTEQSQPNAGTSGTLTVCTGTTPTEAQLFAALGGTPTTGGVWSGPVGGSHTDTVAATAPCTAGATSTVTVTEQSQPNAGTSGTLSICTGSTVTEAQLNAVIGTHDAGSWSPALAGAGTYTYTVAATAPCTAGATSTVTVTEQSQPNAGTSGTC